jgi:hypothetical protein
VDDGVRVGLFGDQVGRALKLVKVVHAAIPRVGDGVDVDVGFVPDDPVVDAAGVAGYGRAHKLSPRVAGIIGRQPKPLRQPVGVARPVGNADQQTHDHAPGRQLGLDLGVADFGRPAFRSRGLYVGPLKLDARPADAQAGGGLGRVVGFNHAKLPIGLRGGRFRPAYERR